MTASAAAPTKIKGTSITTPTETGDNHTLVLGQLKEVAEIAQRLRGDPKDSFVRVSELMNATGARLVNNTVQPANSTQASAGTVSVADSISGDGSSGSPLQLVGDSASPGNNMVYGTNGSGVKSWYAAGGGSYTPPVTTKGDLFGFTTVPARVTVGSNGKILTADSTAAAGVSWQTAGAGPTPTPLTIPNLQYWFDASQINGNAGSAVSVVQNFNPPFSSMSFVTSINPPASVSATQLNSKNVLAFNGSNQSYLSTIGAGPHLPVSTGFVVFNATGVVSTQSFMSGSSGCLQWYISASAINLADSAVAVIGSSSAVLAANTWYQANYTYNDSTGAYAFRIAQAAQGSGSNAQSITGSTSSIGYTPSVGQYVGGSIAEIILYDRVLSPTEITTVEAYLHTKWGV